MESWKRWASWLTTPVAWLKLAKVTSRTSWPSMRTDPDVTSYRRDTKVERVVLPAPDGPTRAVMVPGSATNDTWLSTNFDSSVDRASPDASNEAMDTDEAAG